jgi:hypothetical protein
MTLLLRQENAIIQLQAGSQIDDSPVCYCTTLTVANLDLYIIEW